MMLIVVSSSVFGKDGNWFEKVSKIRLTLTTKQEVEKIFPGSTIKGVYKSQNSETVDYKTNDGFLDVTYSLVSCSASNMGGYNLSEGTVIRVYFRSFKLLKVSKLKLDLTRFEGKKEDDTENWQFSSDELGTMYTLWGKKQLSAVLFYMTEKQKQQFSCQNKTSPYEVDVNWKLGN